MIEQTSLLLLYLQGKELVSQSVRNLLCHDLAWSAIDGVFLAIYSLAIKHGIRVFIEPERRREKAYVCAEPQYHVCMGFFFFGSYSL